MLHKLLFRPILIVLMLIGTGDAGLAALSATPAEENIEMHEAAVQEQRAIVSAARRYIPSPSRWLFGLCQSPAMTFRSFANKPVVTKEDSLYLRHRVLRI